MGRKSWKFAKVLVVAAAACVVLGFAVKLLWNWLMPSIFGLHAITYWQALGLLLLGKLLFGGFHRHGGRDPRSWKWRMEQKMARMSPEDRERFRAEMRSRWGCRPREYGSEDRTSTEQAAASSQGGVA